MWNAILIRSLALPVPPDRWAPTLADTALDLAVWFAACAALGATLSWLRTLARRAGEAPVPGPRLVRPLATRAGTLARA
jgi:hypothetical protein